MIFGRQENTGKKQRKKDRRGKKPVKVNPGFHSALVRFQRDVKKQTGVEPSLGELVEDAFREDPVLREVVEEETGKDESRSGLLDDEFMKL